MPYTVHRNSTMANPFGSYHSRCIEYISFEMYFPESNDFIKSSFNSGQVIFEKILMTVGADQSCLSHRSISQDCNLAMDQWWFEFLMVDLTHSCCGILQVLTHHHDELQRFFSPTSFDNDSSSLLLFLFIEIIIHEWAEHATCLLCRIGSGSSYRKRNFKYIEY